MKNKKKGLKQVGLFLLDKSGSMNEIRSQAISGFNEYIQTLKKNKVDMDFTLSFFDTDLRGDMILETPYRNVKIATVEPLTEKLYEPDGGTPLYDAAVKTIEDLVEYTNKMSKVAVSVVIMTDGEENSSKKENEQCLKDLIHRLTHKGNWTFAYLGANQDTWDQAQKIGVMRGNTTSWNSTKKGTQKAFSMLAQSTTDFSESMMDLSASGSNILRSANYFGKQEKQEAKP